MGANYSNTHEYQYKGHHKNGVLYITDKYGEKPVSTKILDKIILSNKIHTIVFDGSKSKYGCWPFRCVRFLDLQYPEQLNTLKFDASMDIGYMKMPVKVNEIIFCDNFNGSLDYVVLPDTHTIIFGSAFNREINDTLFPKNLHTLTLGNSFNKSIDRVMFPISLHTLTFGDMFDQNLDNVKFPDSINVLNLGRRFNKPINKVTFPNNLHTITFGNYGEYSCFNQPLNGVKFPDTVQNMYFGTGFSQNMCNVVLPTNLRFLDLRMLNRTQVDGCVIPSSVTKIIMKPSCFGVLKLPYGCIEAII